MKPIKFNGSNVVYAENQPEYIPLPALRLPDGEVITCWELSDEEIEQMVLTKRIYISQLTFLSVDERGETVFNPLQPIRPMISLDDRMV